jgi:hypothetical protein
MADPVLADDESKVDYLVVTVLMDSELRATLCAFGITPNRNPHLQIDASPLYIVAFHGPDRRPRRIGITSLVGKGNVFARSTTTRLLERTKPEKAFLVGTAAGIVGSTAIGDVVVSTEGVHYYEKNYEIGEERSRPQQVRPKARLGATSRGRGSGVPPPGRPPRTRPGSRGAPRR